MPKAAKSQALPDFHLFLREAREKAGLSQGDVAKHLGYSSPQFVSNWERGLSEPPTATLRELADLFGVPTDQMFDIALKVTIARVSRELRLKFDGKR